MSELPEGWVNTKLSDVAQWGSGGTPSRTNTAYYGGTIPWVKTGELGQGLIMDTEEKLTELGMQNSSAKLFPNGSVAIAMYGATIGKTAILGIDATTNQACAVGIPKQGITTTKYLFYYLSSQKEAFIDAGKGGAQPNISQGVIKDWSIPLAPLAEQKRIADKLDALLARVDGCRARLARVPAILKRFRQAVLAAATSGALTADWREENPDIKAEFFASHVVVVDDGPLDLPINWSWVYLESLCDQIVDCPHSTPKWAESGRICVRTTNFKPGYLDLSEINYVTEETYQERIKRLTPKPGDILYSREGGILGIACMIPPSVDLCLGQRMMLMRTSKNYLPGLLMYWLNSPEILSQVRSLTGGTASPHLNVKDIKSFPTPLPPLEEQHEIVRRVETLFGYADRLEARYTAALTRVERLTPALLAKAFRGELVAQDSADEPAALLLERVQAARGAMGESRAWRRPGID